jgi:hypothetical protein
MLLHLLKATAVVFIFVKSAYVGLLSRLSVSRSQLPTSCGSTRCKDSTSKDSSCTSWTLMTPYFVEMAWLIVHGQNLNGDFTFAASYTHHLCLGRIDGHVLIWQDLPFQYHFLCRYSFRWEWFRCKSNPHYATKMIHNFQAFQTASLATKQVHLTILHSQVGLVPLQSQTFSLQEEACFYSSFLSSQICEAGIGDEMMSKNQVIIKCFAYLNKCRWLSLKKKLVFILHSFQNRFVRQRLETK